MKPTTQNILNWLNNLTIQNQLNQFKQINPNYSFNETTVDEAYKQFELNKELLIKAIEKNIFNEQIPFVKRQQINNALNNIGAQLTQIAQPQINFNAVHPNAPAYAQAIINGMNALTDILDSAKLQERLTGFSDYSNETKELSEIKKAYIKLIKEIEKATENNKESQVIYGNLKSIQENLLKEIKELENEKIKTQQVKTEITGIFEIINRSNQDIEDKKIKISAFHKNIEEYQKSILQLETNAKDIIAKEVIINDLIRQAENALNLKSAEGISAAFSSHYAKTYEKNTLSWWMVGASFFVASAVALTVWIVIGDNANSISAIIGRIVAVAISITGATFCAKQYVKGKNILEDYAYKSVLAKSIIAFTEEIKKRDDKKVAEYLSKVLDEIHKDPLRSRDNNEDKNIGINAPELVEKLVNILSKGKT